MEIGIDIDDTLVVTYEPMLRYADKFNEEKYGEKKLQDNIGNIATHHYLSAIFEWDNETKFEFFRKYYADVLKECKIKEYAAETVRKLKEAGHKIYFISARLTNIEGCDAVGITLDALKKNNVPFDKLVVDAEEKVRDSVSLGVDVFVEETEESFNVDVTGEDAAIFIGKRGDNLEGFGFLINSIYNKNRKSDEYKRVVVDSDGYKGKREETLKILAARTASRVVSTGRNIKLEPMSANERRIIHSALADHAKVETVSNGKEPYRYITVVLKKAKDKRKQKSEDRKANETAQFTNIEISEPRPNDE